MPIFNKVSFMKDYALRPDASSEIMPTPLSSHDPCFDLLSHFLFL
jgi:hypothetical protein